MKKILAILLALLAVLSLAACGKKSAEKEPSSETQQTQISENTDETADGDPAEYSMDYWAQKYPDKNICPFSIEEGGVETPYYLIMEMGCAMEDWIETPFNWNGWHKVGSDIVNKDETCKMTEEWVGEDAASMFPSCCTVTTESYDPAP